MSENIKNDDMEIDLIKLFKDVLSRLWIIIISFIVCVAATVFYLLNTAPIYEASASMMVEPLSDTSISSLFEAGFSSSSDIATELEILNSRSTYENAIRKLDLSRYTTSDGIRYSDLESPLSYEGLRNSVTVESVSDTSYLKITVQDTDPVFARDFCNALAESYSEVLTGITRNSASNQLAFITDIIEMLSVSPLKFIIFIDDLTFSSNDDTFSYLKAVLEGGVNSFPNNVVVYVTSNYRHLIKENFNDRQGDDIHIEDTIQQIMSLTNRFGIIITFQRPDKDLFVDIVLSYAKENNIKMDKEELIKQAESYAIRSAGRSPRVARQFIETLL